MLADRPLPDDPATPRYLDLGSIATPAVALANAARETLRMADVVEAMLAGSRELLDRDDRRLVVRLRRMDDVLDRLHVALKRFLSELAQTRLRDEERDRLVWTLAVALNLEQAGDIIDKGLLSLATKRMRRRLRFAGWELAELEAMHDHLAAQLRLAVSVFMASDLQAALRLVEEKERFRDRERASTAGPVRPPAGGPAGAGDQRPPPRHGARPQAHRGPAGGRGPPAARAQQPAAPEPSGAVAAGGGRQCSLGEPIVCKVSTSLTKDGNSLRQSQCV